MSSADLDKLLGLIGATKPLPEDPVKRADIETVLKDGYVVLDGLLDEEDVKTLADEVDRMTGDDPKFGRKTFEGWATIRIYSLLNKCVSFFFLFDEKNEAD
jgi:hypothetical protein